jgi:hypothetical protein
VKGTTDDLYQQVRTWRSEAWNRMSAKERAGKAKPDPRGEVSDGLARCAWVLFRAFGGFHHVPETPKIGHDWIEVVSPREMATVDGDVLTRLVVFAHDAGVRVSVSGASRMYSRMYLHPRTRARSTMEGCPTLEEHIEGIRSRGGECPIRVPEGDQ